MLSLKPDMASLATGSVNFPTRVYENSPDLVDWLAAEMLRYGDQARGRGVRPVDDLPGRGDAEGGQDQGAAARAVRHGREERDAGRPRGLRVLRPDAEAPGARCHLDRRRHRPRPADADSLVAASWAAIAAPASRTTSGWTGTRWRRRTPRWSGRRPTSAASMAGDRRRSRRRGSSSRCPPPHSHAAGADRRRRSLKEEDACAVRRRRRCPIPFSLRRPGRRTRRDALEFARHHARDVGAANRGAVGELPRAALRQPRPRAVGRHTGAVRDRTARPRCARPPRCARDRARPFLRPVDGRNGRAWLGAFAPQRLDTLVLCNTSARIGTPETWNARIDAVRKGGMAAIVDTVLARWYTPEFLAQADDAVERTRAMLLGTPADGYVASCAAVRDMDQREDASRIAVPTLVIAGTFDAATPPEDGRFLARRSAAHAMPSCRRPTCRTSKRRPRSPAR